MAGSLKQTPFHRCYADSGARLVDFAGWELPVQFSGLVKEHQAVRSAVGAFDVSHMGEARVRGNEALDFANYLVTNDVHSLADGQALYSPMCNASGGIIDDLLVYRVNSNEVFFCFNGATVEKDLAWMREVASNFKVELIDETAHWAQLAVQGPRAQSVLEELAGPTATNLGYYRFVTGLEVAGQADCMVARTGYTGEDGFEIFIRAQSAAALWDAVMETGAAHGIEPCGLGCRDTLRLEAKFLLYGNDITEACNPLEAGLGWTVKFDAGDFVGRDALADIKASGVARKLVGFEMTERGIARHDHRVVDAQGKSVGVVTSGTHSPTLGKAIGLAYVPEGMHKRGTELTIEVRSKNLTAVVVRTPFYKRPEPLDSAH